MFTRWPRLRDEEAREDDLHPVEDAGDVDVDLALGGLVGLLEERAELHDPRVVDEDVDRPELLLGVLDELLDRRAVGDVELEGDRPRAELVGGALRLGEVEVADRDLHPLPDEAPRRSPCRCRARRR